MLVWIMLGATALLSLLLVWIVEGMFKREAPFGAAADYIIGMIGGVGVAALDYFVFIPGLIGSEVAEWFRLAGSLAEGTVSAWLILWILRQIVRAPVKEQGDT